MILFSKKLFVKIHKRYNKFNVNYIIFIKFHIKYKISAALKSISQTFIKHKII